MSNLHKNVKNIIGQTFGYLTVISFSHSNNKNTYWRCRCMCGKEKVKVRSNLVQAQNTISCGCKTSENISKSVSLSQTEASFNEIFRQYKFRSKYAFELTKEQFKNITSQNCHYCNRPPKTASKTHNIRHNGVYVYNGIDRKNNTEGYTLFNSLPCCVTCNKMKLDMTYDEFLYHVKEIYEYQKTF